MVWKSVERIVRFVRTRQVGVITASATVVVGLVLYEKLKVEKVAYSDFRPVAPDKQGAGDWVYSTTNTLSSSKTGIRWDENWDK